jgi:hypothetical protein
VLGKRKNRDLEEEKVVIAPLNKESLAKIIDTVTEYSYDEEAS